MNKNTGIIVGVIALLVIVGGVYGSMNNKDSMVEQDKIADEKVIMEKKGMEEKDAMLKKEVTNGDNMDKKEETSITKNDVMVKGSYESYTLEKVARAETGDVVLFFHASWCPSCRGLNSSIESNLGAIPEGVSILKTDYDKESQLKKKYGVTYQHTLVQVDKDGNMIKKWSGSPSLDSLLSQIQ